MDADITEPTWIDVDADGRYLDAAPDALEAFGVSLEELRRHRVGDFAPKGIGPIHLALFRWVAGRGRDFGGGSSTIISPDGRSTRIKCTSIDPVGDHYRVWFVAEAGATVPPQPDAVASVLEAWREAEREIEANGQTDPVYQLARDAAHSLRDIYHWVVQEKTAAMSTRGDED